MTPRVDTEVGPLRTVVLHRPGPELQRLTPRNADRLLFDGIPWVERAQLEHDRFAATLERHGVRVLLLADLLRTALQDAGAREQRHRRGRRRTDPRPGARGGGARRAGGDGARRPRGRPGRRADLPGARSTARTRWSGGCTARDEFAIDPLPNLMFTRDSSMRVGDRVVAAAMGMPARRREAALVALAHRGHPELGGVPHTDPRDPSPVEGGDVLLLAPGVLAVGVGERTSPAGAESFARAMFDAGLAHTVLAVPITQRRATMHLDTVATMVDVDTMVVFPDGPRRPAGLDDHTRPADRGPGAVPARRRPRDGDRGAPRGRHRSRGRGRRARAVGRRQQHPRTRAGRVVAYERNTATNGRMRDAGIEVVTIEGFELGSGRGGPRCLSCPWERDLPS